MFRTLRGVCLSLSTLLYVVLPVTGAVPATRQTLLSLPFASPPQVSEEGRLVEVRLFVALDGSPEWTLAGQTSPEAGRFVYRARRDGDYQFLLQAIFAAENGATHANELCRRRIVVDTKPPRVMLKGDRGPDGQVTVSWRAEDANLAENGARLLYRLGFDGAWQPVAIDQAGVLRNGQGETGRVTWWVGETDSPIAVRGEFADCAGNIAVGHYQVGASDSTETLPVQPVSTVDDSAPTRRHVLGSREIEVEYDIAGIRPEQVCEVQLWITRDGGGHWELLASDPDRTSPIAARIEEEGRYGLRIVARADCGQETFLPAAGTLPEFSLEIDLTTPEVRLTSARWEEEKGTFRVSWEATDARFSGAPISLFCGPSPEGPWTELVSGHPNTGVLVCPAPRPADTAVFVRIEAVDEAGNVGYHVAEYPAPFDVAPPTARIRAIRPASRIASRSGESAQRR